ncbi:MAG: DUF805 domain-containing protein [Burkholderiaceae bacterium]|nr:DUF805 domain-containing protein [Burkholderiaceae bacterium]
MNTYIEVAKKYMVFTGRSRRTEYWTFTLINVAIFIILSVLGAILGLIAGILGTIVSIISMLFSLVMLLPGIAAGIRRLHDTGRSGWWLLIVLIPFVGGLILIYFLVLDSQPGSNQYGANPKEA